MKYHLLISALTLLLAACQPEARPVRIGEECVHCRMQLTAPQYAAELVTKKGRQYLFDDLQCLVRFLGEEPTVASQASQLLVAHYQQPARWLPVTEAVFVQSQQLRTPMGGHTVAVATEAEAQALRQQLQPAAATQPSWPQLQREFAR